MLSELIWFSFKKMGLKTSSAKWRQFCLGLNVLTSNVLSKNFKESRCMDFQFSVKTIENKRLLILQLCRHWWYRKLSIWQLAAPPVTTKLSNWRPSLFNDHENLSGPSSEHMRYRAVCIIESCGEPSPYRECWCLGDTRDQPISSHDIDTENKRLSLW